MADDLSFPRILCLHGGGTSADIFSIQCRVITRQLGSKFRFVFLNAPFTSRPHEAILPYFAELGPFYRWLRWNENEPHDVDASSKILHVVEKAMKADPGRGEWVGVMGFSQGAKLAASLLWAQEKIPDSRTNFKFGVIMAGRAPVVVLDPKKSLPAAIPHTAEINEHSGKFTDWAANNEGEHVISIPTLHVHGLKDGGLEEHRALVKNYCKTGTTRLVEWDGDHRVAIQIETVDKIAAEFLAVAREAGVRV